MNKKIKLLFKIILSSKSKFLSKLLIKDHKNEKGFKTYFIKKYTQLRL